MIESLESQPENATGFSARSEKANGNSRYEIINIEPVVANALSGDEEAYAILDRWMDKNLRGSLISMGVDAPDLIQKAKMNAYSALANFDPDLGENGISYTQKLRRWVNAIGRNVRMSEFRRRKRYPVSPLDDDADSFLAASESDDGNSSKHLTSPQVNWAEALSGKIDELLSRPSQREIVRLTLSGRNEKEIAELLERPPESVRVDLSGARKILEQNLLFPAGLRRVGSFADEKITYSALHQAARRGAMETVMFLNLHYATPEAVARYNAGKKNLLRDRDLLDQGYILAMDVAESCVEYKSLCDSNLTIRDRGRVYVKPEELDELRRKRQRIKNKPKQRIMGIVPEGLIPLSDLARDVRKYNSLAEAARKNRLPAVKVGHRWLVDPKEVEIFLEVKRQSREPGTVSNPDSDL